MKSNLFSSELCARYLSRVISVGCSKKTICSIFKLLTVSLSSIILLVGCATTSKSEVEVEEEKKVGEVIGTTGVIRPSKDVYLELSGDKLVNEDRTKRNPDYIITVQAKDRLRIKTDKKTGMMIILDKSAKEANMSEELFELLKKYIERSNEYILNIFSY